MPVLFLSNFAKVGDFYELYHFFNTFQKILLNIHMSKTLKVIGESSYYLTCCFFIHFTSL